MKNMNWGINSRELNKLHIKTNHSKIYDKLINYYNKEEDTTNNIRFPTHIKERIDENSNTMHWVVIDVQKELICYLI